MDDDPLDSGTDLSGLDKLCNRCKKIALGIVIIVFAILVRILFG